MPWKRAGLMPPVRTQTFELDIEPVSVRLLTLQFPDWHAVSLFETMSAIVAQTTQRFFTNTELCRNDAYIQSLFDYSVLAFTEGRSLMKWPRLLHPFIARFHPTSRKLQQALENVNKHLFPFVEARRTEIAARRLKATQSGAQVPSADEWVAWLDDKAGGEQYNPGVAMVSFSVASFHTTTDFMCQLLCDLARNPALITELEEEASYVLKDHTWTKSSFANLELMDRCMRECQRLKPIGSGKYKLAERVSILCLQRQITDSEQYSSKAEHSEISPWMIAI